MDEELSSLGGRMYWGDNAVLRLSPELFAGVHCTVPQPPRTARRGGPLWQGLPKS